MCPCARPRLRRQSLRLRDICPHRAYPLSFGQFDGANVECAYHGWQFDAHTGQCREIPVAHCRFANSNASASTPEVFPAKNATATSGCSWPIPKAARLDELPPPAPEFPTFSRAATQMAQLWADLPCGIDQAIIGLMDPAHGLSSIRPGGGAPATAFATKPRSSSRFPTASA